jgi:hypothetical protein
MAATYPFLQVSSRAGASQRPWMQNHSGPTRGRAGAAAARGSGGAAVAPPLLQPRDARALCQLLPRLCSQW